jgi:hypothetical protein
MINFPIFLEGLLMPLLGLGIFFVGNRSKRSESFMHCPPINYLVKWLEVYLN